MRPAPSADELDGLMRAFDDVCSNIPTHHLRAAFIESMHLTDKNGQPIYWDGRALLIGYAKFQEKREGRQDDGLDKSRLLANPGRDCPRCAGTDPNCPHNKLTPEEEQKRREELAEQAAKVRESLKNMASVKAMPAAEVREDLSVTFTCTEPACGRKVSSAFGWQYNDRCDDRIPGPVREGERLACEGVMKVL